MIRDRDTQETSTVRARYMIAADGSRSGVRERLGIQLVGRGVLSNSITIYFRAAVGPLLRGRNLSVIMVNNPTLRGFFRIEKPFDSGFLVVNTTGDPRQPNSDLWTGLDNERAVEYLRAALGDNEVPVEIDSVMRWNARADVASEFRQGRVFLAGDAAHVMPPYGGWGGNTGVQDAHNLAWKLALVCKGAAGEGLLDTYEAERHPAAVFTTEQAYMRYVTREAKYLDQGGLPPSENDLNIELGVLYQSRAVIPEDDSGVPAAGSSGSAASRGHENPRDSKGRPGSRAPHLWLAPERSTLDLFGRHFVLLTGPEAGPWRQAAEEAAQHFGLPVEIHRIEEQSFSEAYGIEAHGAVLVRPDGYVAWRSAGGNREPKAALLKGFRALLG